MIYYETYLCRAVFNHTRGNFFIKSVCVSAFNEKKIKRQPTTMLTNNIQCV